MPARLDWTSAGFASEVDRLVEARRDQPADVTGTVSAILADVAKRGDAAISDLTLKFDRIDLASTGMRFSADEIAAADARARTELPDAYAALKVAAERISAFHAAQRPQDFERREVNGSSAGARWSPIDAVGIYVPGGRASYPSSVLMNAIPAQVAGVRRIVMVTPTPGGEVNPLVLAAAGIAGVTDIFRIGGAQAVAALAYGTQTISAVGKIVGPGNAYVAEAKRQVFGRVGIDMIAGPSEILVVADRTSAPRQIAADLLSQAEHDPVAQSILITDDGKLASEVEAEVEALLPTLATEAAARASWNEHGAIVILGSLEEAPPLIDRLAPEHLLLAVANPLRQRLFASIRHAGSIFLGRHTPEAVGDYVGGPNHVLPTMRAARYASGLSVTDFMKRTTFLEMSEAGLAEIGPHAVALAEAEGLPAHALSVKLRLG